MIYKSTNETYKLIDLTIYKDNLDFQRITELKLESHDLLWVNIGVFEHKKKKFLIEITCQFKF